MATTLGPYEYHARQFGSGPSNSGPCGRRKMRKFAQMRRELADAAKKYSVVLACNDQHRSQGTGIIGKAEQALGNQWRKRAVASLIEHAKGATS